MNTDGRRLKHQELTEQIIGVFFEVYNEMGPGFLESVYIEALGVAFRQAGLRVEREIPLSVHFRGEVVGHFRADLVVGGAVLVEAKACACLHQAHKAQVLNYLRATVLEVALLLNFGPRPTIRRLLLDNTEKTCPTKLFRVKAPGTTRKQGAIRTLPCSSVATHGFSLAPADPIP
jgi:GxxExxY protein